MPLPAKLTSCYGATGKIVRSRTRNIVGAAGMAATVLLHFLFFAAAMWPGGSKRITRLPDAVGAGANSGSADGSSTDRMIIVQLTPEFSNPVPKTEMQLQLAVVLPQSSMLKITGPDSIPLPPLEFDEEGEPTQVSEADLIARTKLAGLYESQVRARIERAWNQPSESVRGLVYSCRVKVRQKRDGHVEDVTLDSCEGSFEWLDSLVRAIYSASPLPGAPHPGVFAQSFSMVFRSDAGSSASSSSRH